MKIKRILCLFFVLIFSLSFSSCKNLVDLRDRQYFKNEDFTEVIHGSKVYKKLPLTDHLLVNSLKADETIYITKEDVPVLFSEFGIYSLIDSEKSVIIADEDVFVSSDQFDSYSKAVEEITNEKADLYLCGINYNSQKNFLLNDDFSKILISLISSDEHLFKETNFEVIDNLGAIARCDKNLLIRDINEVRILKVLLEDKKRYVIEINEYQRTESTVYGYDVTFNEFENKYFTSQIEKFILVPENMESTIIELFD